MARAEVKRCTRWWLRPTLIERAAAHNRLRWWSLSLGTVNKTFLSDHEKRSHLMLQIAFVATCTKDSKTHVALYNRTSIGAIGPRWTDGAAVLFSESLLNPAMVGSPQETERTFWGNAPFDDEGKLIAVEPLGIGVSRRTKRADGQPDDVRRHLFLIYRGDMDCDEAIAPFVFGDIPAASSPAHNPAGTAPQNLPALDAPNPPPAVGQSTPPAPNLPPSAIGAGADAAADSSWIFVPLDVALKHLKAQKKRNLMDECALEAIIKSGAWGKTENSRGDNSAFLVQGRVRGSPAGLATRLLDRPAFVAWTIAALAVTASVVQYFSLANELFDALGTLFPNSTPTTP